MLINFAVTAWYRIRLTSVYAGNFNIMPTSLFNLHAFVIAEPL